MTEDKKLHDLIESFAKLPSLGKRSARRLVLHLLNRKNETMQPLIKSLEDVFQNISHCITCGNLTTLSAECEICQSDTRNKNQLCVVEQVSDLWAIERSKAYSGRYWILGGLLSQIDGITPKELKLFKLVELIEEKNIKEVIIALNAINESQTTIYYIQDILEKLNVEITILAQGIPIGGELDYLDEGTILTALNARKKL